MSWHSVNPIMPIDLLIPERLEFRNFFSGFRTGNIFACECPKFQVAGPLPRVYLDTIQEMEENPHPFTPCGSPVERPLCWDHPLLCTLCLFYPSHEDFLCRLRLAPSALNAS